MAAADFDRMIAGFESRLSGRPDYAQGLLGLAEVLVAKKQELRALELARKAMAAGPDDATVISRGRQILASLAPRYHVPMMNDSRRNAAWQQAMNRAVRPGMNVLEIGTGAGMLALMAARAGARLVTTCEHHQVVAQMAREIAERNGYGDTIRVIGKASQDLKLGIDLPGAADLLFCDIFSDNMVGFGALQTLSDARRLLTPEAPVMPAAGTIRVALANWDGYSRSCVCDQAAGFDISSFQGFVPDSITMRIGDPGIHLLSDATEAFHFDFSAPSHPAQGSTDLAIRTIREGRVNGIVQWIRLQLDAETILEARPEPGAVFFSSPIFYPLPEPVSVRSGDSFGVTVGYIGKRLTIRAHTSHHR